MGDRKKILVIRGGAIGDFILTLPALRLIREGFPDCRIEIIGYRHICAVATGRYYAEASRSIEYAPMAGFFNPKADHDRELAGYFSSFGQVISYLYDPDRHFAQSLERCGVRHFLSVDPRVKSGEHAARHLARPLEQMALFLEDPAAVIYPSAEDVAAAEKRVPKDARFVALHPGSGSPAKNWPLARWRELIEWLCGEGQTPVVVGGESDAEVLKTLREAFPGGGVVFLEGLPLPELGAVLSRAALFIGHDSGISHLAAAAGARCVLLFGPTYPAIWAPANPGVNVLRDASGLLENISLRDVCAAVESVLSNS